MLGISPLLYTNVFYITILLVTWIGYTKIAPYTEEGVIETNGQLKWMGLFIALLALFLGFRPLNPIFADTMNYAQQYRFLQQGLTIPQESSDWLFELLMVIFAKFTSVDWFFLTIEILYLFPMFIACKRWTEDRANLMMLFCIGAFSFYTYAVNGLRQGVACSAVMLALTYIGRSKRDNIIFGVLAIIAMGFHKSAALPLAAAVFSLFYKNPKGLFYFWIASIGISLVAGGAAAGLFSGMGFDERMNYVTGNVYLDEGAVFSSSGFRWDFLLYSSLPILLGWYVVIKRELMDDKYYVLLATYILSNAFWVIVIRAPFSNRFAYLSWFLYPIVVAYPLLQFPVFNQRHSQKTAMILLAHFGFTFLMWMMGKI